jgi:hypothetical protein
MSPVIVDGKTGDSRQTTRGPTADQSFRENRKSLNLDRDARHHPQHASISLEKAFGRTGDLLRAHPARHVDYDYRAGGRNQLREGHMEMGTVLHTGKFLDPKAEALCVTIQLSMAEVALINKFILVNQHNRNTHGR